MKKYEFKDPLSNRPFVRQQIKDGDIVAFDYKYGRGVAQMKDEICFYSAYNLSGPNEVCYNDGMPVEIQLLHPSKDDMFLATIRLMSETNDDDNLPEDFTIYKDLLYSAETTLMPAIDKLQSAIKNYNEMQDYIAKRWQKELDKEKQTVKGLKKWYEDETKKRDVKIEQLEKRIKELEAEAERLKQQPSEDSFVERLVKETKNLYKHEKVKTEVIRQILYKVGRSDAEAELDAWIEGKERPSVSVAGDYVANKHVENEVNGVASGATGISVNKKNK